MKLSSNGQDFHLCVKLKDIIFLKDTIPDEKLSENMRSIAESANASDSFVVINSHATSHISFDQFSDFDEFTLSI